MPVRVIRIDEHVSKVRKALKNISDRVEISIEKELKKPKRRIIPAKVKKSLFKIGASFSSLLFAFSPVLLGWWVWSAIGPEGFWQGLALFAVSAIVLFYPIVFTMVIGVGFMIVIWGGTI